MGSNIEYIGTTEAARLLQMTGRRVVGLCSEGKLSGAFRLGRNWKIPVDSVKQYMRDTGIEAPEGSKEDVQDLLPVAIGNTSYIEVSSECYYVDKTLLIRDLIDDHNMVTLFTRPRRFGKTLAINQYDQDILRKNARRYIPVFYRQKHLVVWGEVSIHAGYLSCRYAHL